MLTDSNSSIRHASSLTSGWRVDKYDALGLNVWRYTVIDSEQNVVAAVHSPNDEARAHLIAAAPELLEACKAATVQRDPRHRVSMLVNDWQRIETAIAKAEGRES